MAFAWEARASAAPWRACAAVTSRALSRAFCMAAASVRGAAAAAGGLLAGPDGPGQGGREKEENEGVAFFLHAY